MPVPLRKTCSFYGLTFLYMACFSLLYVALWRATLHPLAGLTSVIWWSKVGLELVASFYFFSVVLKSADYLLGTDNPAFPGAPAAPADSKSATAPANVEDRSTVCLYLCAGDLDRRALESLCRLEHPGRYLVIVHDDSGDPRTGEEVDKAVREIRARTGQEIRILRRPERRGGKPGAVNYVLDQIGDRHRFLLLADNDSTAVDAKALVKALPLLEDRRVAAVQFRNVGVAAPGESQFNVVLRRAIEVFDLFARHQARHGLMLFLGHNALLRTAALREAGGLREGIFADDVDLSVRLVRRGWRILYAPEIPFGETHPISHASFRLRAYKWAFGCGQVLRRHFGPVLLDRRLSLSQKLGLLEFVGFYAAQGFFVAYLLLVGFLMPAMPHLPHVQPWVLFLGGWAIVGSVFLPSFAYFRRCRRPGDWWPFALICAVVYGSMAFTSTRGLAEGLLGRRRRWIPTNLAVGSRRTSPALVLEGLFGLLLVAVPAVFRPFLLWQVSTYLFAVVFLASPFLPLFYAPACSGTGRAPAPRRRPAWAVGMPFRILSVAGCVVVALLLFLHGQNGPLAKGRRVGIEGNRILVDGKPFLVKGIHYSPWPPGTGPMKDYPYPDESMVDRDLGMIKNLGANTILVHDAPTWVLRSAAAHHLMVIYTFFINWQSIGDDAVFGARSEQIVRTSAKLREDPNLLAILLGNEVPEWVLKQKGQEFIESRLKTLYDRVKQVAPGVPVSHSNWPVTRSLKLSYMDLACFNLYPSWPREVVVAGYGDYIQNVLQPIAGGRPLLITEFGQNSLEATEEKQAKVLKHCWAQIRTRTAGGVVFSFADEWWKNYDNPVPGGDFWKRQYAPDDEKTHDLDPEEYYGIFTAERAPKPASYAVREMFTEETVSPVRISLYSLPLLLLFGYTIYVFSKGIPHGRRNR